VAEDLAVMAIFTDIRGFTKWSEANEVFINLDRFITGFRAILQRRFPQSEYDIKPLGDGALLIRRAPENPPIADVTRLLQGTLRTITHVEHDFDAHCADFAKRVGHATNLKLGWGIVRGKVLRVGDDWTGHNLNKCSRLCNEARPFGLVIDRDDFPELPKDARGLTPQIRRLRGIGEVAVWASAAIASQFLPRERIKETPEVHVAGTCFGEDRRGRITLLFARRSVERSLFPGKLEGCGGQLRRSEGFAEGVSRHFRQELGIDVEVLPALHRFYEIREPLEPVIPGIRFLCRRIGTNEPASDNHSELTWVSETEFRRMPAEHFVGNLKQEVIELLDQYKRERSNAGAQ
jgi:class 3 adenylate cyclase/isopentenyldiphosphate isomerase